MLRTVQILAAASRVSVLDLQKLEVFLPVRAFFGQGRRAVTHFNPLYRSVIELTGFLHVSKVFSARDGTAPERAVIDRLIESFFPAGFYFCGHEVAHGEIVLFREKGGR